MFTCHCKRAFTTGTILRSHQRSCLVYKIKILNETYKEVGYDHVVCGICHHKARDLTFHIKDKHMEFKETYERVYGPSVCSLVDKKRKETTLERHGDSNFRNEEARKFAFSSYEGGHPLSDPEIREKQKETKRILYGDPNYVNAEKKTETNLHKYGVEHYTTTEEFQKKAKEWRGIHGSSMKGRTPHNKKEIPSKEVLEEVFRKFKTQDLVAGHFGISDVTLLAWKKARGIVVPKAKIGERVEHTPRQIVKEYLDFCRSGGCVLSFIEFSKEEGRGNKWVSKIKRVFGPKSPYSKFKEDFDKVVTFDQEDYQAWLCNFSDMDHRVSRHITS